MQSVGFAFKILKRRVVFIPLILLLILIAYILIRPQENQVQLSEVSRGEIRQTVSASGRLSSKNTIKLRSKLSGEVTFLEVEEGDLAENGQLLLSLENTEQAIALKQAENTLREKQTALDKVLDDIHLFQYGNGGFTNIGSANETQTQRNLRTQAEVAKDNAYDSLKLAQKKYQDSLIYSPIQSLVLSVNTSLGQTIALQEVVIELADLSAIFFDAEVDQADIFKVKAGQQVEITLDSTPDKVFKGIVFKILPKTQKIASGADVVIVRIRMDNFETSFIHGLSGQGQIITSSVQDALIIPIEALKDDNKVVVKTATGLEERDIELGIQSETDVEVKQGLAEGEKVVLNPPFMLSMGRRGILRFLGR